MPLLPLTSVQSTAPGLATGLDKWVTQTSTGLWEAPIVTQITEAFVSKEHNPSEKLLQAGQAV